MVIVRERQLGINAQSTMKVTLRRSGRVDAAAVLRKDRESSTNLRFVTRLSPMTYNHSISQHSIRGIRELATRNFTKNPDSSH